MTFKSFSSVILTLLCTAAVASPGVVGTWKGHVKLDPSSAQKLKDPKIRAKVMATLIRAQKETISIVMKPDHSAVAQFGPGKPTKAIWSLEAGKLYLDTPGKKKAHDKNGLVLSKDGKTLTLDQGHGTILTLKKVG